MTVSVTLHYISSMTTALDYCHSATIILKCLFHNITLRTMSRRNDNRVVVL